MATKTADVKYDGEGFEYVGSMYKNDNGEFVSWQLGVLWSAGSMTCASRSTTPMGGTSSCHPTRPSSSSTWREEIASQAGDRQRHSGERRPARCADGPLSMPVCLERSLKDWQSQCADSRRRGP